MHTEQAWFFQIWEESKGAPVVGCYMMNQPFLLIQDPEIAKEVMVKQFSSFHDRQSPAMMDRWEYCQVWPLANFSLFAFWLQSLIC